MAISSMTDDERIDRVAARMASHYGLDFAELRDEPEQADYLKTTV